MQLLIKVSLSVLVILAATGIARRFPSLAGLVGVMPLTGALVLAWVHVENRGEKSVMLHFAQGALWGILPSILFFVTAAFCIRKGFPLAGILSASFTVWLAAACVHQWMLSR